MKIATDKLNFTVGPVMMDDSIKDIGMQEIPYFRTKEFSALMFENECLLRKMLYAEKDTRVITLTGSGTAGMEAVIMNMLGKDDRVLIINGGGFGARFVRLCQLHCISYEEIRLPFGKNITASVLNEYNGNSFSALLVNCHETSTGVSYDMELISDYCRKNHCFLIVDAISSFIADPLKMQEWGINVVITGSQKAFAVPPGLSLVAVDGQAIKRVQKKKCGSMYFDFKEYLKDGERGQTPFTPAVGTLIQLNQRLNEIITLGIEKERERIVGLATHFRRRIQNLPLTIATDSLSNAITPLFVRKNVDAYQVFETLANQYGIWVCPNGGNLRSRMFRVGHIGNLTEKDNDRLIAALEDICKKGGL